MIKAIVGANWGDEGKGKITDMCASEADIVARYQGGSNAGHTIINDKGKFALHLLPSGVFYENVINVIANGVALNIRYLLEEMKALQKAGIRFQLKISNKAQILLEHHIKRDVFEEERLGARQFGSTKSGIAPFYADKYSKQGIQLWQIYEDDDLLEKLKMHCDKMAIEFYHLYKKKDYTPDANQIFEELKLMSEEIREYVCDTASYLRQSAKDGKNILLEGQLGALRDIEYGVYPYVTSSSTLAGYAAVGAGLPPYEIKEILAVTKAYSSSVGESPFVTELFGKEAEELRMKGGDVGEFGATTGRPRRVGYFDAVATRYGCETQGATSVALTGLDVLGYLSQIPVCVAYEIDGKQSTNFLNTSRLYVAKPVYKTLPSWQTDIRGVKNEADLPDNAKRYISFIEESIGVKISYISTGPEREAIIKR